MLMALNTYTLMDIIVSRGVVQVDRATTPLPHIFVLAIDGHLIANNDTAREVPKADQKEREREDIQTIERRLRDLLTVNAIDEAGVAVAVIVNTAADDAGAAAIVIPQGFGCGRSSGRLNERLARLIGHQRLGAFQQHVLEVLGRGCSCGGIGGRHVNRAQRAAGESSRDDDRAERNIWKKTK